jgi:hypothetical protein
MAMDRQPKQDNSRSQHDKRQQATKVVYRVKGQGPNGLSEWKVSMKSSSNRSITRNRL